MFFLKELEKTVQLHPSYFGPQIRHHIHKELLTKEEGSNTGKYTIVCVLDAFDISDGLVIPGTGYAEYIVHYKAVVWAPFRGEVIDGLVTSVIRAGFFVDCGSLQCFVGRGMIPSEIKFDANATPPQWTDDGEQIIEKGTTIRIKIKGLRVEVDKVYAVATIKEDYLGHVNHSFLVFSDANCTSGLFPLELINFAKNPIWSIRSMWVMDWLMPI